MDAKTTKKVYAAPALASHGSVVGKTEASLEAPPLENDSTFSKVAE